MPAPGLEWRPYRLPAARRDDDVLDDAPAEAADDLIVELPELQAWPFPSDKAEILLQSAAEVEHALMVQYLYAVYSLKAGDEVADQAQFAALDETAADSWPRVLLGIAREEMGHLMTVQNLLAGVGLPPNLEREDFPPRKELYPFALHLEPLSRHSLAKYIAAEAPADAEGIDDILALAKASAGSVINRVGVLYGLLGLVFTREEDVAAGSSGSEAWDAHIRELSHAAYQQAPPVDWHLPDEAFVPSSLDQQADPDDWGGVRIHRIATRADAVGAIRDVAEQGEGPTGAPEHSHFERLLSMCRGGMGMAPFPSEGEWVATRDIPTDPSPGSVADPRTRAWAELADVRYALLLGFVGHYLLTSIGERRLFVGWIFSEMRSRLAVIARQLTAMPTGAGASPTLAAAPFTLPTVLALPAAEASRWDVHRTRLMASIRIVEELQSASDSDASDSFLSDLAASDRARLAYVEVRARPAELPVSFVRDICPLFRPVDIAHMRDLSFDLSSYQRVRDNVDDIIEHLEITGPQRMPPSPDQPWSAAQIELVRTWMRQGFPP